MDREIVLSSYSVKGQENNTPQDFTTKFNRPIILDSNSQYMVGLNRIVNMSFTWFNVNSSYGNQLIKYSSDNGSTFQNINFQAGVWNYTDFNKYIKNITKTGDKYPITIEFDDTTFRVTVTLAKNYQLDLTASNFNDLIGFDKEVLKGEENIGPKVPNLSQDTDILNIHCDLINDSLVDGQDTDIIYSFSTSVLRPSYSFTIEPRRVTYNPTNKNNISSIKIYITDGKRRLIGPLQDPVTWYGINYAGTKMTQWDFQNKGTRTSPARLSFVLEVPLRHLRPSVIYSVPCDRILQRAY